MREEKLKELSDSAYIELNLEYCPERSQLVMELEHNGEGFDYQRRYGSPDKSLTHGRGIVLASELCDSLEYSKQGRSVTAVYSFAAEHHFPSSS